MKVKFQKDFTGTFPFCGMILLLWADNVGGLKFEKAIVWWR